MKQSEVEFIAVMSFIFALLIGVSVLGLFAEEIQAFIATQFTEEFLQFAYKCTLIGVWFIVVAVCIISNLYLRKEK